MLRRSQKSERERGETVWRARAKFRTTSDFFYTFGLVTTADSDDDDDEISCILLVLLFYYFLLSLLVSLLGLAGSTRI